VAAAAAGTHAVRSGETLSSISRNYGISRSVLAAANGLDPNAQVQIGRKLVIPGAGASVNPVAAAPKPAAMPAVAAAPATKPAAVASAATQAVTTGAPAAKPATIAAAPAAAPAEPKPQTIAAVKPSETPDDIRTASGAQFRWPVRGRVISGFGPKPGGQKNEGINVSVPEGTAVKAAEDGVVAYAGSELKGYGNLVLIKHSDGYVTAYAHNSELDVKKGDAVKRGQVIAKAGQTGNVTSPQVHFEIRKGSEPVDPSQYLAGL
jgi:murein DD-endopeptidase MepM/ murein hydrolase activator NlpD